MRHKSVSISGDDMLNRIDSDTDTPWRDVIGWNCARLDELEAISDPTPEQEAERDAVEAAQVSKVAAMWWSVSWPEHVTTPRFNSDAMYAHCEGEAESRRDSELAYNE